MRLIAYARIALSMDLAYGLFIVSPYRLDRIVKKLCLILLITVDIQCLLKILLLSPLETG